MSGHIDEVTLWIESKGGAGDLPFVHAKKN
jgi:hypothetical protein